MTRSLLWRYAVALVCSVMALLPWIVYGKQSGPAPFLLFLAAVMISSWYGGLGTGLLTTIIGALAGVYFFAPPTHSFSVNSLSAGLSLVTLILVGTAISWLNQQRGEAEDNLRQSRDQLAVILQGIGEGITVQAPNGTLIYANATAARLIGYPTPEALTAAPQQEILQRFEVMDEEGQPLPPGELPGRRALQGEEAPQRTVRFRIKGTGEERWSVVSSVPVVDEDGMVRFAISMFRDITESRRAQEERDRALREADAQRTRLHTLFMQAPAIIAVSRGPEHVFEIVNERFSQLMGGRQMLGKPYREALPEIYGTEQYYITEQVYRTGEPFVANEMPVVADWSGTGKLEERYFNYVLQPTRDAEEKVDGTMVHGVDVTEQVRSRRRVEQLASEREAILGQMAEGVMMLDAAGQPVYMNPAARTMLGLRPDDDLIAFFQQLEVFAADGRVLSPDESVLRQALRGETVVDAQRRIRLPDGREIVALTSASPVVTDGGTRLGAVATLRDMTEQYTFERQREDFLAAAAHDLKTPLAAIKGHAQIVLRRARRANTPETQALLDSLTRIDTTASRMAGLVNELLDATRIHLREPLDLNRRPFDLLQLTRRLVAEQRQTAQRHKITVQTSLAQLVGSWDEDRIDRVLSNLLSNAIKYSPEGGTITVTVEKEECDGTTNALLSVQDQGIGIPQEDIPHIFQRFYRGTNVSHQIVGTGIGLSGVQQIVRQHGGTVTVESREGQGSTFTILLPIMVTAETETSAGVADSERTDEQQTGEQRTGE